MMDTLFVITLYSFVFSCLICVISLVINILTIGRRFDKQFKDIHIPWDLGIPFYSRAQRCNLYMSGIINSHTKRYRKGPAYKLYGDFDFRAHCSYFEICNAYILFYITCILIFSGILNFTIEYFT